MRRRGGFLSRRQWIALLSHAWRLNFKPSMVPLRLGDRLGEPERLDQDPQSKNTSLWIGKFICWHYREVIPKSFLIEGYVQHTHIFLRIFRSHCRFWAILAPRTRETGQFSSNPGCASKPPVIWKNAKTLAKDWGLIIQNPDSNNHLHHDDCRRPDQVANASWSSGNQAWADVSACRGENLEFHWGVPRFRDTHNPGMHVNTSAYTTRYDTSEFTRHVPSILAHRQRRIRTTSLVHLSNHWICIQKFSLPFRSTPFSTRPRGVVAFAEPDGY